MTSYDDRPVDDPWAAPTWSQPPGPAVWQPARTPGIETRQVLLILGAGCLVAALAAGTAVVWHSLGPTGQAALMVGVTSTVLAFAVRLERLPATAQALGAVGVAGLLIDSIAGRSLAIAGARDLPLHVYAGIAATTVAVVLAALSIGVRRLWAPPIGCAVAATAATVAWIQPMSLDRAAWLGPAMLVVAVLVERVLAMSGRSALAGRYVNASLAISLVSIGAVVSVVAAVPHRPASLAGAVLVVLVLVLPEATGIANPDVEKLSAYASGVLAGALVVAATQQWTGDAQVVLGGGVACLGIGITMAPLRGLAVRVRTALQAASVPVVAATYALVSPDPALFAHLNITYAVICIIFVAGWRARGASASMARAVAAVGAVAFATIGVDLQLHLDAVTTPEAYVLVPAVGMLALGAAAMVVRRETSSWCLVPGLSLGLLPTLGMALRGDSSREALALAAGAALVVVGAQLRLAAPLAVGGTILSLIVVRLVGPEVKRVPEWVALGAVGIVLLVLGATWEARMLDLRRAAHALRPRITALR
ncbi:MAG: hypothetical protein QOC82_2904 [Frankiaceae bacterium]|nr:hypothetical protein [Frankiaceae bacterium]